MLAAALLVLTLATVEGTVTFDNAPLPGCAVIVRSADVTQTIYTDANGQYRFDEIPEGEYEIAFELEGLESATQRLIVRGEAVRVPQQDLRLDAKLVTLTCGGHLPCDDEPPADRYAFPLCSDYHLNEALIQAAERGDTSAIAMLETRYASERSDRERYRIGDTLLGKSRREADIWKEIEAAAEIAIRFPNDDDDHSPEFIEWCATRGFDPDKHWFLAYQALGAAVRHPRSRALFVRALETNNNLLVSIAIDAFGLQRDLSSLPLIEKALQHMGDEAPDLVQSLAFFGDPRADALAEKYLEGDKLASYREVSAEIASEPRQ